MPVGTVAPMHNLQLEAYEIRVQIGSHIRGIRGGGCRNSFPEHSESNLRQATRGTRLDK